MAKYLVYISVLCFMAAGNVQAQTFDSGFGKNTQAVEETAQPSAADLDVAADDEEEPLFTPAKAKLSGDDAENDKKYDNSRGKVIHFKIVNNEVVFEEDKERNILIYYEDYKVTRGLDKIVRCSMRIYVLNDLETKISNLGFKLKWQGISTSLQMLQINPGVSTYTDIMLLGEGCFTMDKAPNVEVNRCRVKGMTQEQCADRVKWFARNRH
ncbi:MAG: hypothetical protein J6Y91_02325 [Alphaproteobacteria bacterium]|nr:hypothetical protein [Alphaproteobacteria bacterium]